MREGILRRKCLFFYEHVNDVRLLPFLIGVICFCCSISHFSIIFVHFFYIILWDYRFIYPSICLPFLVRRRRRLLLRRTVLIIIGWSSSKPIWIYINRGHYASFYYPLLLPHIITRHRSRLFERTSDIVEREGKDFLIRMNVRSIEEKWS